MTVHLSPPVEAQLDDDDFAILAEEAADAADPYEEPQEQAASRPDVVLLWEAVQELYKALQVCDHLATKDGGHPEGEEFTASYTIASGHWHAVLREMQNVSHASVLYVRPAMALEAGDDQAYERAIRTRQRLAEQFWLPSDITTDEDVARDTYPGSGMND